jgi:hypothetical protein
VMRLRRGFAWRVSMGVSYAVTSIRPPRRVRTSPDSSPRAGIHFSLASIAGASSQPRSTREIALVLLIQVSVGDSDPSSSWISAAGNDARQGHPTCQPQGRQSHPRFLFKDSQGQYTICLKILAPRSMTALRSAADRPERGAHVRNWSVRDLAAEAKMRSISNPDGHSSNSYGFAGEGR